MQFGYACANCGSTRTSSFHGDHHLVCVRCDECSHVEYRVGRDDEDVDAINIEA